MCVGCEYIHTTLRMYPAEKRVHNSAKEESPSTIRQKNTQCQYHVWPVTLQRAHNYSTLTEHINEYTHTILHMYPAENRVHNSVKYESPQSGKYTQSEAHTLSVPHMDSNTVNNIQLQGTDRANMCVAVGCQHTNGTLYILGITS